MRIYDLLSEEYHSIATQNYDKTKYTVFVNPSRSEIKELKDISIYARFIADNLSKTFYAFSGQMLHRTALNHLKLNYNEDSPITKVLLGVGKILPTGLLEFYDTNQNIKIDLTEVSKIYQWMAKFFS